MVCDRFDSLTRNLVTSRADRRRIVTGLFGAAFAAIAPRRGDRVGAQEAAAKRCLNEGKECKRDTQCCSGLCKNGECRGAPGQGRCTIDRDVCKTGEQNAFACGRDGDQKCACVRRLDGSAFCAGNEDGACFDCDADADCAREFGAGFVCVRAAGKCACPQEEGTRTGCVRRCPNPN
jgi:hypothetical protein